MFKLSTRAMRTSIRRLMRDEGGATAIEYAMIASGVSIVIAATIFALGANVKGFYTGVSTALN